MKVTVIGGGAAGMLAAITAARNGADVTVLEKNEKTGKKLYITGKGRCNVTNASPVRNHIDNILHNGKFMFGPLGVFDSEACMNFFEELGVPLKIERGNRVFPVSDKSSDIINALNKEMKRLGVDVRLNEKVLAWTTRNGRILSVRTEKGDVVGDYFILATGGITYPATGSTGDGYRLAAECGHKIVEPKVSLCDILFTSSTKDIQGLPLKNIQATVMREKKALCSEFGEMLFTDRGVGGPVVLSLSARLSREQTKGLFFVIDMKPALTEEQLDRRLVREFESNNKALKNVLVGLVPKGMIPYIIGQSGVNGDKQVNTVTKEERKTLATALKNMTFTVAGLERTRAVITAGGVSVSDISPKTMRSKSVSNLAFAGEVIDVDAMTGGYNLQIAFATGYVAGTHIYDERS